MLLMMLVGAFCLMNVWACWVNCCCKPASSYLKIIVMAALRVAQIGVATKAMDYFCDNRPLMVFILCGMHRFQPLYRKKWHL